MRNAQRPTLIDVTLMHALIRRVQTENSGFLVPGDLHSLATNPVGRLTLVLVRCGGCRFLCPAQDVAHLTAIITRDGYDYVRDVSLPATTDTITLPDLPRPELTPLAYCGGCGEQWPCSDVNRRDIPPLQRGQHFCAGPRR